MTHTRTRSSRGFTLAELAIVLVIVGLLLGGLFVPLSAQLDSRNSSDTQKTLNDIREALLGFAAANGRLPCPAPPPAFLPPPPTTGIEAPVGGGACTNASNGFVPAVTLGIGPANAQGYAIDAWNNPIHYAVTAANASAFTTNTGMKTTTMTTLAPDLQICADSACATRLTNVAPSGAVAVIFSTGKAGITAGRGNDENENLDSDTVFVSHDPSTLVGNEFDDQMLWLSANTLYNRMITAGQLP